MIYYITGGTRSGKSSYAQQLALSLSPVPIYVATARRWDKDFEGRIVRHIQDRGSKWQTVEEEKSPSAIILTGRVMLIDCVTLWLTNLFMDFDQEVDLSLNFFKREIDKLQTLDNTYIIVSNEIGMGVHAETAVVRKFTDLQGWANQYVAKVANEAIFMVSGIPMKLK